MGGISHLPLTPVMSRFFQSVELERKFDQNVIEIIKSTVEAADVEESESFLSQNDGKITGDTSHVIQVSNPELPSANFEVIDETMDCSSSTAASPSNGRRQAEMQDAGAADYIAAKDSFCTRIHFLKLESASQRIEELAVLVENHFVFDRMPIEYDNQVSISQGTLMKAAAQWDKLKDKYFINQSSIESGTSLIQASMSLHREVDQIWDALSWIEIQIDFQMSESVGVEKDILDAMEEIELASLRIKYISSNMVSMVHRQIFAKMKVPYFKP